MQGGLLLCKRGDTTQSVVHRAYYFDGAVVQVYPDISRQTRIIKGMLRPLLEVIREAGATPSYSTEKQGSAYYLRSPDQLLLLFQFLN